MVSSSSHPLWLRLNPSVRFFLLLLLFVTTIVANSSFLLFSILVIVLILLKISGGWRIWIVYLKTSLLFLPLLFLLGLLSQPQTGALSSLPSFLGGFYIPPLLPYLAFLFLKLLVVMSVFSLLSIAIRPTELLRVLLRFHLPHSLIVLTSVSLRLLPLLLEEIERLKEAQMSRGAKIRGLKGMLPILLPLISNSLERSVSIAETLESRGILSSDKRTIEYGGTN